MAEFQLAQINIARMKGVNINDPVMLDFVNGLNPVNAIAESSKGFVWRLKDESNNATNINPYNDEQLIINVSVWDDIKSLEYFMYETFHRQFLARRKEWFLKHGQAYTAMWWIKNGQFPTVTQACNKLEELQRNGASASVFDFKTKYPAPSASFPSGE